MCMHDSRTGFDAGNALGDDLLCSHWNAGLQPPGPGAIECHFDPGFLCHDPLLIFSLVLRLGPSNGVAPTLLAIRPCVAHDRVGSWTIPFDRTDNAPS